MTDTFDADGITLHRLREHVWEMDRQGDTRVPGRVLASEALLEEIKQDRTLTQLRNTTHLPGIQKYATPPTATRDTASPSAAWRESTQRRAAFRPELSDMI